MGPAPPPLPQERPAVGQTMGVSQPNIPTPPDRGLAGYRMPVSAQIASGLDQFMTNFYNTRNTVQAGAHQKFNDIMQGIALGATNPRDLDYKKIMKLGREAGIPLRTEAPTPEETQYEQASQSAQMATANSRIAGNMYDPGSPMQQIMAQGGTPPPAGPPPVPAQPSLWQRIKQGVGIRPPVSLDSPYGQDLQAFAKASWEGGVGNPAQVAQGRRISQLQSNLEEFHKMPLAAMDYRQQAQLMDVAQRALQNDPQAIQQLTRWGTLKGVPGDDIASAIQNMDRSAPIEDVWNKAGELQMWGQFGMPLLQHKLALAKDLLPRFAGAAAQGIDPQQAALQYVEDMFAGRQPTIKPSVTTQEGKDIMESTRPITEAHPTVSVPVANMYQMAVMTGNTRLQGQLGSMMGTAPTKGSMALDEQLRRFGLDKYKTLSDVQNAKDRLSLDTVDQMLKMGGAEAAGYFDTIHDKNSTPQEIEAAKQGRSILSQKLGQIKVPIPNQFDKDGKQVMFNMTPQDIEGALNWWDHKWLNVPPYLRPSGFGGQIPNQQSPFQGDETPGMMDYIGKYLGRMLETPAGRKAREQEENQ